jgi:hypothetical protein
VRDRPSSHPTARALILMLGVLVVIVVLAAISTFTR